MKAAVQAHEDARVVSTLRPRPFSTRGQVVRPATGASVASRHDPPSGRTGPGHRTAPGSAARSLGFGEITAPAQLARLALRTPRLLNQPRGNGQRVIDLPGWKAPEASNVLMRTWLRRLGYDAHPWGLGTNQRRSSGTSSCWPSGSAPPGAPPWLSSAGASAGPSHARWPGSSPTASRG